MHSETRKFHFRPERRLPEQLIWGTDGEFSQTCSELWTEDRRAGGVTDAGGWVTATLEVDCGSSVVGEKFPIVLSGVERWWPTAEVGGVESECSSRLICAAGGLSSAPSCPWSLSTTSSGFATNLFTHGFSWANSRSLQSISGSVLGGSFGVRYADS